MWFNRFQDVADRQNWSDDEKLDELLPRLQGVAGDFVYGQLSRGVRSNYKLLCKELSCRFRVIETSKTFWMKFTNRNQLEGESVEEYAAELKKLYDKAHSNRDSKTRTEDLLRRFLDGMSDEKARFHIEFVKEPTDIDEAVYATVCFQETKQRKNKFYPNEIRSTEAQASDDSDDDILLARAMPGKNKHKIIKHDKDTNTSQSSETLDTNKILEIIRAEIQSLKSKNQTNYAQQNKHLPYYSGQRYSYSNRNNYKRRNNRSCFVCGDPSHFKSSCPQLKRNQTYENDRVQSSSTQLKCGQANASSSVHANNLN